MIDPQDESSQKWVGKGEKRKNAIHRTVQNKPNKFCAVITVIAISMLRYLSYDNVIKMKIFTNWLRNS